MSAAESASESFWSPQPRDKRPSCQGQGLLKYNGILGLRGQGRVLGFVLKCRARDFPFHFVLLFFSFEASPQ